MQKNFIFDSKIYRFVLDHRPENNPVIPFVSVIDAMHYTTRDLLKKEIILFDIRLMKGLIVPEFKGFEVTIVVNEQSKIIEVKDIKDESIVYYKASFEEKSVEFSTDPITFSSINHSNSISPDYDFLFHGPMLHSMESLTPFSEKKESFGKLKTAHSMKWDKTDWLFDPFIYDGALQMACQLAYLEKKKHSLPSKVGKAVFYKKAIDNHVDVKIIFHSINILKYVFSAYAFDKDNQILGILENVESFFRLKK